MADEKKGIDRIRRNKKWTDTAVVMALFVGMALLFSTLPMLFTIGDMVRFDHLTDPSIPAKDLDNATYTYTAQELLKMVDLPIFILFGGLAIMMVGFAMLYVNPSDKDLHIGQCKGSDKWTYCPECGLKLSRLEKD